MDIHGTDVKGHPGEHAAGSRTKAENYDFSMQNKQLLCSIIYRLFRSLLIRPLLTNSQVLGLTKVQAGSHTANRGEGYQYKYLPETEAPVSTAQYEITVRREEGYWTSLSANQSRCCSSLVFPLIVVSDIPMPAEEMEPGNRFDRVYWHVASDTGSKETNFRQFSKYSSLFNCISM